MALFYPRKMFYELEQIENKSQQQDETHDMMMEKDDVDIKKK